MDLLTLLIIVLIIAWALGAFTIGGNLIHLLLVIVVVIIVVRLLRGERL